MSKTKTPICILSAFLIISMSCIGAIQVQAADPAAKQLNRKLVRLTKDLLADDNLKTLVEDEQLIKALDQIKKAETQEDKEYYAGQYVDLIQNDDLLKKAFDSLVSKYSEDIVTLTDLAERIYLSNKINPDGKSYKAVIEESEFKVEKVDNDDVKEDEIILTPDLTVKTTDMDFGLLGLILIFLVLPGMLLIAGVIYIIIAVIQEICIKLKTAFDNLELLLGAIGIFAALVGFLLMVFEEAIEQITTTLLDAMEQLNKSKVITFRERIQYFFAKMFSFFKGLKMTQSHI